MPISIDRIRSDIETIASATSTVAGADRPTFSDNWRMARDHVAAQAQAAGCHIRIDAAGNLHARPKKFQWDEPLWLSGSHVDSVPGGGDFDGIVGVITPLEVLRAAHDVKQSIPLELIIFAEEEGTTFGLGMLGSRAWIGELNRERLSNLKNAAGKSYVEAGAMHDVQPELLDAHRLRHREYRGFVETHVEQGPGMWNAGQSLAIVEAIAGRHQYRITIRGVANHAGSTSMRDRQDAMCGAATLIIQIEGLANGLPGRTVATVGNITCKPNAVNVIPDEVIFTIDFRSDSNDVLNDGEQQLRHLIEQTCQRRGLSATIQRTENAPVVKMDRDLCAALRRAAQRVTKHEVPITASGALHDAAILAPHVPTAMLFIASKDGISHNPAEFSRMEDIALAASTLHELVMGEGAR